MSSEILNHQDGPSYTIEVLEGCDYACANCYAYFPFTSDLWDHMSAKKRPNSLPLCFVSSEVSDQENNEPNPKRAKLQEEPKTKKVQKKKMSKKLKSKRRRNNQMRNAQNRKFLLHLYKTGENFLIEMEVLQSVEYLVNAICGSFNEE